jgi:YHS domain-containing protein
MRARFTLMLAAAGVAAALSLHVRVAAEDQKAKCPVKGVEFTPSATTKSVLVNGQKISFCCNGCPAAFAASPEKYVTAAGDCPVMAGHGATVAAKSRAVLNNDLYYFCCGGCPSSFKSNPSKYVKELTDVVTKAKFAPTAESPRSEVNGQVYVFASTDSKAAFDKENAKYVVTYK